MKKEWLIAGVIAGCFAGGGIGACGSSSGTGGAGVGASGAGATSTTGSPTSTTGSLASTTGSPNSTTTTTTTTSGGGSTTTTTSGGGTTTATTGNGGSTSATTGAGGSCHAATTLHPPDLEAGPGTIYCPFSETTDGGKDEYCTPGTQHCCVTAEGSTTPSSCVATGTACISGATDFQCEDPVADCQAVNSATPVCCASPSTAIIVMGGTMNGMTCENYTSGKMTGSYCTTQAACGTGILLCTSDAECVALGKTTCVPFEKAGNDIGGCM